MALNKVISLRSKRAMLALLEQYAVPRSGWHKTKSQLFKQIKDGETTFAIRRKRLTRLTWRAQADVYRVTPRGRKERLHEVERIVNGEAQSPAKGPSVSEKMMLFPIVRPPEFQAETHEEAIIRCFLEELGVVVDPARLRYLRAYTQRVRTPSSFPLDTIDFVFLYEYEIPFEESKPEYVERRNRKKTTWRWKRSRRT